MLNTRGHQQHSIQAQRQCSFTSVVFGALVILIIILFASSCVNEDPSSTASRDHRTAASSTQNQTDPTEPPPTATLTITPTVTPSPDPTATLSPTPIISMTPDFVVFDPGTLWQDVEPGIYNQDTCEYIRNRWDPEKSSPGTIVAPFMFHSIRGSGRPMPDEASITEEYFDAFVQHALELGFETITTDQLIDFLESNAPIPKRSMIMILDDRRPGVTEFIMPYLEENQWTLTLGWIIEDQRQYLWDWMERLASTGMLDVQSHGYWHRYIVDETPEEQIIEELYEPIPILEDHFGERPYAFIWPGGNFTSRSVEIAREAGYRIGFSSFTHGPIMFNWIPQKEKEQLIGDPLMSLPRYWGITAWINLDQTVQISEMAIEHACQQYPLEASWYQNTCGEKLPPLSSFNICQ
ncbi:MAG: polysaccharide deacetylase family protein [Anaerolineales bacterium]|nr:polysaccharide deacetylase family protein [Anaerolineales bacterium]